MKLEMLLVTNDREVVNAVRPGLERLGIAVQLRAEPLSAREVCDRRRFDGLIIDLEIGAESRELLARVRRGRANRLSSILAVSGASTDPKLALAIGANFSLQKPLCADTFDQYLKLALAVMVREYRRYFRFPVQLPVVIAAQGNACEGKMLNVSEGGLAVRANLGGAAGGGAIKLSFAVPGGEVEAAAQIVWADAMGTIGLQFIHMSEQARQRFHQWLELLRGAHREDDAPETVGVHVPRLVH